MMLLTVPALVYGLLLGSTQAAKDDSYYIAGTGNPNGNEKMYWKDAENIFQDLSQFSELYVEFHNCAWTWMETNEDDNDIDENDYWYLGKIPPMGANVAYSLYGSLKGETFGGCGESTFINSFHTNSGFTNFARAMNYAGLSGFSSYSYDDDSSSSYTASCSGGYGIGCDYSNGFAVHTYSGDECNPANYTGVKDKLSNLNSAMNSAQCTKIFDYSSYSGSPYGTSLELLAYSHSCFYQDFFSPDGVCPDPYGKLAYYQQQFYNGIQESKKQDPYQVSQRKKLYNEEIKRGKTMAATGLCLAALAFVIMLYEGLVACFGYREAEMRKFVPRQNDFIITKRSKDDDLETPTVGDKSDTSSENYVTMSNDTSSYAPPATVAPPVVTGVDVIPPPQVEASPVLPQQVSVAPAAVAPTVIPPPLPGNKVELKGIDQEEPVTVYAPPSVVSATEKQIVTDSKTQEAPPVTQSPPSLVSDTAVSGYAVNEDPPKPEEKPVHKLASPEEFESVVTVPSPAAESPSSLPTDKVTVEAPALAEAPSLKSLADVDNPTPLFANIRGSSSQLEDDEKMESSSIPSIDEIVASREFDSDSDDDDAQKTAESTLGSEEEPTPVSVGDFSKQAAVSQYFDANEIEADKDDIEQHREEDATPDATLETPSDDAEEQTQDAGDSAEAEEEQAKQGEAEEEVTQSSSWFSFTI